MVSALAMVLVAVWFRGRSLENIPGTNGDEAWYGVQALEVLAEGEFRLRTPTGNPVNLFFLGPAVLLHAWLPPSMALLRLVSVLSGIAMLGINWLFCRWVFDRRTAVVSTVLLAVLPINIAYSRFAWDASQSVAATLPVVYLSLAAVRFGQWRGRLLAAAVVAEVAACLVHPTNLLAGAAIVAAAVACIDRQRARRIAVRIVSDRRMLTGVAMALLLTCAAAICWLQTDGAARFTGRLGDPRELIHPRAAPHFSVLYARLFTGATVYQYIPGSRSWLQWPGIRGAEGWGVDVALFWALVAAAVWWLWRSWKMAGRREDRVLLAAWAFGLAAFLLTAGTHAMTPGWERFAICLIAPAVVLLSRGAALFAEARAGPRRLGLIGASLLGWFVLADFHQHYFAFIEQTGGRSHATFRTAAVEPKQAALQTILNQRALEQPAPAETTWVVAGAWWNYWPLRYRATAEENLRVVTPQQAAAATGFEHALQQGRVWFVEFPDSRALADARATLTGREVRQWDFRDFGGRPAVCLLHGR